MDFNHDINSPPLTSKLAPVISFARSAAKNNTALAMI